jgi:hypothetical protein
MNIVAVSKPQCLYSTGPVQYRTGTHTDLFGVPIEEKPAPREKRLGYLSKTELIEAVRKIFPNARVLPNISLSDCGKPRRLSFNGNSRNE